MHEFIINNEIVTLDELNARRAENRHELEVTAASFDTGTAILSCPDCTYEAVVEMADNGNLNLSNRKTLDKGDPFASHSYCVGGCTITGVDISQ